MANVVYEAEPKMVEALTPAPNANTGGKLYASLLRVKQQGDMSHLPEDSGFFLIATFSSRSSAASTVTNIKHGKRKIPEGKWSFTSRSNSADNSSVLYAKYLGEQ